MIEMVVIIAIVAVLVTIVTQSFGGVQQTLATRSASEAVRELAAVARARAVERGTMAKFVLSVVDDRGYVIQNDTVVRAFNFKTETGVDVTSESIDSIVICMTPRGFPDIDCNSFSSPVTIGLTLGAITRQVRILPMGKIDTAN